MKRTAGRALTKRSCARLRLLPVRRLPIRVKLSIAFVVVMALVLGATGLFVYVRFHETLDGTLNQGLRTRAADVKVLIREADSGLAQSGRDRLAGRGEQVAQILDAKGRIVDAAPGLSGGPALSRQQVARALSGRSFFVDRVQLAGADETVRLYVTPVDAQDQRLVAVVGSGLETRDDALRQLGTLLLIGGPAALLLASLAGFFVTGAALRPVEAMRRRASAISASEPGHRLPVPPARDEISRLGDTLNEMLGRLESAFARERSFVADASHELRSPLSVLKTELELALRGGRTKEELEEALRSAADETDRLAQLAEDLLVIARSDEGRLPIRAAETNARKVLNGVRDRYSRRAAERGTRIEVDAPEALPLTVDPLRIEQAVGNLVDNALRYGRGPIEVSGRRVDGHVELSVRDHGAGFPPDFVATAFERFTRFDSARSRGGAGLGLAIVAAIAAAHGGTVAAMDAPGGGATVVVRLPGASSNAHEDV
jgi:two-component system OmpR family sensor kinase